MVSGRNFSKSLHVFLFNSVIKIQLKLSPENPQVQNSGGLSLVKQVPYPQAVP